MVTMTKTHNSTRSVQDKCLSLTSCRITSLSPLRKTAVGKTSSSIPRQWRTASRFMLRKSGLDGTNWQPAPCIKEKKDDSPTLIEQSTQISDLPPFFAKIVTFFCFANVDWRSLSLRSYSLSTVNPLEQNLHSQRFISLSALSISMSIWLSMPPCWRRSSSDNGFYRLTSGLAAGAAPFLCWMWAGLPAYAWGTE